MPNEIHVLKDYPYQVLSNQPSSLRRHLRPMQLNRVIIHNDGERLMQRDLVGCNENQQ